jgi:CubicO group peptidase (beta-lactamase class C family)
LGIVIERLSGLPLDEFCRAEIWSRLGMRETCFTGAPGGRCAPTEGGLQGVVHDPTARLLGGVAGHAGLFSTLGDLQIFMSGLLGGSIVRADTLEMFTRRASSQSSRALGWDTVSEGCSAGSKFGPRSFGHTGFTGTSIWVDPDRGVYAILLTNRVYPTADNVKIKEFRPRFHDAVID